jgi:hypothetical protein
VVTRSLITQSPYAGAPASGSASGSGSGSAASGSANANANPFAMFGAGGMGANPFANNPMYVSHSGPVCLAFLFCFCA